jgi:hypothetical protein
MSAVRTPVPKKETKQNRTESKHVKENDTIKKGASEARKPEHWYSTGVKTHGLLECLRAPSVPRPAVSASDPHFGSRLTTLHTMAASAAISSVVSVSPKTPKSSLTCESFELPVTGNTPCWITHLRATCAVDAL